MTISGSRLLLAALACLSTTSVHAQERMAAEPPSFAASRWSGEVSADMPLPEYPRPQLVRERWLDLNGLWDYSVQPREQAAPASYAAKILVPFPPESTLSRVRAMIGPEQRVWYRRSFEIPAAWAGQRVLLHFGAVDWEAHVTVNGTETAVHRGGYDGFSCDITAALTASGPQQLVVSAWNPANVGGQPCGKQNLKPGGICYTPATGIWQTVWLEPVPRASIDGLRIVPDLDHERVEVTVAGAAGQDVELAVSADGKPVATASGKTGQAIAIPLPKPTLWWPDAPFLYDLAVTLKGDGAAGDTVRSYFGMRKISIGPDAKGVTRMLLNNRFVFQNGLLDQGFWPEGIYTAPTDAALRSDLEAARALGFNMLRKHAKVEPERWYYWADRLGVLVWQDMPSSSFGNARLNPDIPDREGVFETELRRMVEGRFDHPCIVTWVIFNEGWGMTMARKASPQDPDAPAPESRTRQERMVRAVRELDATRLIDAESGRGGRDMPESFWDFGFGDLIDFHCYAGKDGPRAEAHRAAVIGEYGYGVSPAASVAKRLETSETLGLSALVLTQLTDVETETNGVIAYDRSVKKNLALDQIGKEITATIRRAGYEYPGGGPEVPPAPRQGRAP